MKLARTVRRLPKIVRNAVRDLRYGKPLGGTVKTRYAHLGAHDVGNADYDDLAILFSEAQVLADDVIVDVGSGKGRSLNWLLANHPQNQLVGIEIDPDICAETAKRLRRYEQVVVRCGDATTMLPPEGTLFYLFNPFDEGVMLRFRDALVTARAGAAGRTRIVYYNYKALHVFEGDPRFTVRLIDDPRLTLRSAIVDLLPQAK